MQTLLKCEFAPSAAIVWMVRMVDIGCDTERGSELRYVLDQHDLPSIFDFCFLPPYT